MPLDYLDALDDAMTVCQEQAFAHGDDAQAAAATGDHVAQARSLAARATWRARLAEVYRLADMADELFVEFLGGEEAAARAIWGSQ